MTKVSYNGSSTPVLTYVYGGSGQVVEKKDSQAGRIETFDYDTAGRLVTQREFTTAANEAISQSHYSYDDAGRVTEWRYKSTYSGGTSATGPRYNQYTYSSQDGSLTKLKNSYFEINYSYEGLKRLQNQTLIKDNNTLLTRSYTYVPGANTNETSFLVASVTNKDGSNNTVSSYNYTYDNNGNITAVSGSESATYVYDSQNQLTSETKGGITTTYSYDAAGNILSKTKGSVTDTYTYGNSEWKDLLTA